ncbi:serine hydrolase [Dictyobacter alpinus]|uniref:Serine hydrolase n=1 Tax=Dictyobacter alpinus TaxID=2014873 RepID=A0A402AZP4_9CHLR|nr:serine hydrolase domain-containing protein [Dictyobacter alpinus]GCE24572.1 serine hydrolase [Dictyobacter alpinus]
MDLSLIDAVINEYIQDEDPGAVVAIVKDREIYYQQAYGMANIEWGIKNTPETLFRMASISKQFTASAIMLLEQAGELNITDDFTQYVPGYPTHGYAITIEHLLTHTSGLKSFTNLASYPLFSVQDLTHNELLAYVKNEPLDFAPGTQYAYNNTAYYLLGMIIEAVSGLSYADFMRTYIFEPLDMRSACYLYDEPIIKQRASGYQKRAEGSYENASYVCMKIPFSAGSLGARIEDLIKWDLALREEALLNKAIQRRMYTPVKLNDGQQENYGYGWGVSKHMGHAVVNHSGGINGFVSFIAHFLEEELSIMFLSNNSGGFDAGKATWDISSLILAN